MKKNQVMTLIGSTVNFKRDNVMFSDHRNTFYRWRKGEACKVLGYVELEGTPKLIIGVGSEFDFEEIELRKVEKELDVDGLLFSATKLATAERRPRLAS